MYNTKGMKTKNIFKMVSCFLLSFFILSACGNKETIPSELLNATDSFTLTMELVGEVPRIDGFRIMQGGCVTEDYAWFIMNNEENSSLYFMTECYVMKYDRETMEEINRSEVLMLGHANDVAYIPETNELYVIHVDKQLVSVLDADSLVVKEQKELPVIDGTAIASDESGERFVTSYGQVGMVFRDKELNVTGAADPLVTTLVTQGICADDKYVYHVLWSPDSNTEEPENMIFVFDWEGNLITKIPIGFKEYEPENISLVGDTFYIGFNDRITWESGKIYAGKLVKQ